MYSFISAAFFVEVEISELEAGRSSSASGSGSDPEILFKFCKKMNKDATLERMKSLISIHSLSKSYGTQELFKDISFTLSQGDRVGLLGPNGSGKSTLLEIIVGIKKADSGSISRRKGVRIGYASQEPEFPPLPLEEVMLQQPLSGNALELSTKAAVLLGKAQFSDFSQNASLLSGGWKKRLDIAKALMQDPDILFLDEPTNHLDLEGILWLEKFLAKEIPAYVIVSHDRYFLENVSNKVIELNKCYPQGIFSSDGNMSAFMAHREAFLEAQKEQERGLASTLRDEIEWLKRSPKARTTKSRSRVDRAYQLMDELSDVKKRNKVTKVDVNFSASERETRKLLVAKNLSKTFKDKPLFKGIDLTLSPGSRLGIVGKNGTGKTTLLKVLAGTEPRDGGTIKYADDLKLVYFDQHRQHLPLNIPIRQALAPLGEYVNYRGQMIHVNGWGKKFLFSPDRLNLPISSLSGGERARILIAKLMLEPADILFLDEPTNDLDIQTLEVIEESLLEFSGAVVLISHDRCMMDRLCTQILGLGEANEHQFYADYNQWESSLKQPLPKKENVAEPSAFIKQKPKKLSYKEQRELEGMESAITAAEAEIAKLEEQLESPEAHADAKKSLELCRLLAEAQHKLESLFERWEFLSQSSN